MHNIQKKSHLKRLAFGKWPLNTLKIIAVAAIGCCCWWPGIWHLCLVQFPKYYRFYRFMCKCAPPPLSANRGRPKGGNGPMVNKQVTGSFNAGDATAAPPTWRWSGLQKQPSKYISKQILLDLHHKIRILIQI